MRCAAARAARRRGSSITILRPPSHGSSSSARGTTVVFPAPGGACSTAAVPARSASRTPGSTASIGSPVEGRRVMAANIARRAGAIHSRARRTVCMLDATHPPRTT